MSKQSLLQKHPSIAILVAGVLYLLLNLLIFLPTYLANYETTSFYPVNGNIEHPWFCQGLKYLIRDNFDIFRISNELLILMGLLFLGSRIKWSKWVLFLVTLCYIILFSYNVYYPVSMKLYNAHPYVYNDLILASEVLPIFLAEFSPKVAKSSIFFLLGILVLFIVFYFLIRLLMAAFKAIPWSRGWTVLSILVLLALSGNTLFFKKSKLLSEYQTAAWLTPKIWRSVYHDTPNAYASILKRNVYNKAFERPMKKRPNIYLICVESYGRSVSNRKPLIEKYYQTIRSAQSRLDSGNLHVTSAFSKATTSGGRSWLSFSSIIAGTSITTQIQYNDLIDNHYAYPNMTRFFKSIGYDAYRIKTFKKTDKSTNISYKRLDRWFGFDYWLKHHEIPYKGYGFDFLGGIPDQYALSYFQEDFPRDTTNPMFLFFMNTSSHGPWVPPPPVVEDWRSLDTLKVPYMYKHKPYKDNLTIRYGQAIDYQINYLTDFILKYADDDDLFFLIGDHQPAMIFNYEEDEFDTPVHVIGRDSALIHSFKEYGFSEGLELQQDATVIHHAGVYSMLQREIIRNYGEETGELPEYLPRGIE